MVVAAAAVASKKREAGRGRVGLQGVYLWRYNERVFWKQQQSNEGFRGSRRKEISRRRLSLVDRSVGIGLKLEAFCSFWFTSFNPAPESR